MKLVFSLNDTCCFMFPVLRYLSVAVVLLYFGYDILLLILLLVFREMPLYPCLAVAVGVAQPTRVKADVS